MSIKTFRDTEIQLRLLSDKIDKLRLNVKRESDVTEPADEVNIHFNEVDSELTSDGSTVVHKLHHIFKSIEIEGGTESDSGVVSIAAGIFDGQTALGTTNPHNWSIVFLWDSPYVAFWSDDHWEYYANGIRCFPVKPADWYWINQNGATVNTSTKVALLQKALIVSDQIHMWTKSITFTAPYLLTAVIIPELEFQGFPACGIFVANAGSTPKCQTICPSFNVSAAIRAYRFNSPTSYSGTNDSVYLKSIDPVPIWLRILNDGTNIVSSVSYNGIAFTHLSTIAISAFLGTVNQWGLWVNSYNALETSLRCLSWQEVDL